MPIEVGRFTTEVTVADGDLPLTPAQVEKLIQMVIRRVEDRQKEHSRVRDLTAIRSQAAPPTRAG
jgi:hypothetical protein